MHVVYDMHAAYHNQYKLYSPYAYYAYYNNQTAIIMIYIRIYE